MMKLSMMLRLTTMQQKYVSILQNPAHSLVVCTGPAGSGKTAFACKTALAQLQEKQTAQFGLGVTIIMEIWGLELIYPHQKVLRCKLVA